MTEELVSIFPSICADHDEEKYHIEIELPGVKKEDIELEMSDESFCIKAPKVIMLIITTHQSAVEDITMPGGYGSTVSGGYSHAVSGTDNWAAGGLFQDS